MMAGLSEDEVRVALEDLPGWRFEAGGEQTASASAAVDRGSSGIHLNGCCEDLAAEENIPLVRRQRFEVHLDRFFVVRDYLFDRVALRLASLQFRAPGVEAVLILLDTTLGFRAIA